MATRTREKRSAAVLSEEDRAYFGGERASEDQVGLLEGVRARFGKSYVGEPDRGGVQPIAGATCRTTFSSSRGATA